MDKFKKIIVICFFLITLTGCNQNNQIKSSGDLNDGTYTSQAKGKNGKFDVTVKIKEGKIDQINIGDNNETKDKGSIAIKELPNKIIDEQTYDVDAISGATITSKGIKNAVKQCLIEASKK